MILRIERLKEGKELVRLLRPNLVEEFPTGRSNRGRPILYSKVRKRHLSSLREGHLPHRLPVSETPHSLSGLGSEGEPVFLYIYENQGVRISDRSSGQNTYGITRSIIQSRFR